MTTTGIEEKKCALCGQISVFSVINSTSAFGACDLDTRSPGPQRYTINMWVQTCPSCGYCAGSIDEVLNNSQKTIKSSEYINQLNNPGFPKLANAFLCLALIHANAGQLNQAAWSYLHAAWACDDESVDAAAVKCRESAISSMHKALAQGQNFGSQAAVENALLADLYRRSGKYSECIKTCREGLLKKPEGIIEGLLNFQIKLAGKSDNRCHDVSELE